MKVYIITNFRIDLADKLPGEMLLDDLADLARDNSTIVELDFASAKRRLAEMGTRFLYTVTVERA